MSLPQHLGAYPGRGLAVHVDDESRLGWVYFVTGRSEASRARAIDRSDGALVVRPTTGTADDALRHYACARTVDHRLVVGNGDHVDVIVDGLRHGRDIDAILDAIDPEPDPPIHTPRIALVLSDASGATGRATASLVAVRRKGEQVTRRRHEVAITPGTCTIMTTYDGDREQPGGTAPVHTVRCGGGLGDLADDLWAALDPDLRVLAVSGVGATTSTVAVRP